MEILTMESGDLQSDDYFIGYFGDLRLARRGLELMKQMCQKLTFNIRRLGGNRQMEIGFHRLLDNEDMTVDELEETQARKTNKNCEGVKTALFIDDTSEASFASQQVKKQDFGKTGNPHGNGFFMHPTMVVDPQKEEVLGLASINIWMREACDAEAEKRDRARPIEEKESYKWINSLVRARKYITNVTEKIFVADRECDIYEYMWEVIKGGDKFIVRSAQDRRLAIQQKLLAHLEEQKIYETYELFLDGTRKRQARKAKIHLKYTKVEILRPMGLLNEENYPEKLCVWIVQAEEDESTIPAGEEGILWRLVTNIEITNIEDAKRVIFYYKLRWLIELLFAMSKKRGLDLEASQVCSFEKLQKLVIIGIASTMNVFCLKQARERQTETNARHIFSDSEILLLCVLIKKLEGRTEKQKNPYTRESLSWASWIISRLGGWKGYKSESPPGVFTIRRGLEKFYNMYDGWSLINV